MTLVRTGRGATTRARLAAVVLLGTLAVGLQAPSAHAHALLRSSDPASGARLDAAPEAVSITWTEEPERSLSRIEVLDATGSPVHRGTATVAPDPMTMRVALPDDLPDGVYTVSWRALSKVDGHVTGGAFVFGIGVAPEGPPVVRASAPEDPAPTPLEVAGRWALLAGLGLLIGAAWVGAVAFAVLPHGVGRLMGAAWAIAFAGLVALAEAQRRAAGADYGALLQVSLGRALLWRGAALLLAGVALVVTWRWRARAAAWMTGAAAAGAMLAHVSAGHAAAGGGAIGVFAQWVHVLAAGVWLGGLAALLAGIRTGGSDVARAIRRFSTVAGFALFAVLGTGVVRALNELPGLDDLFSSRYGRVVLVKLALLVALAVLGAVNRYRNVPRGEEGVAGLRRMARPEVVLAALALLAAAVLATLSPPSGDAATPAAAASLVATGSDFAATVRVRLEVEPGFPGLNTFRARVTGFDDGRPVEASGMRLIFTFLDDRSVGESELRLTPVGEGLYRADGGNLSLDGRWQVVALVQTATDATEIPLRVATRCRVQATPVPGQPTLYDVRLPEGRTAQGYVAPGEAGSNEVHVTFFGREGTELAVKRSPRMTATPQGGEPETLSVRRLGPGHFVADAVLRAGTYRFDVAAALPGEARAVRTCFEEAIR